MAWKPCFKKKTVDYISKTFWIKFQSSLKSHFEICKKVFKNEMKFLFFLPSIKPDTCETYLHEKLIDKFIRINSFEWRYHSTPKNTFPGHHFTYSSHVLWSEAGFEPAILGLVIKCSTTVLLTLIFLLHCHFYHWIWNNLRWKTT